MTDLPEAEKRRILTAALDALTWAREWREKAQVDGPSEGRPGERWDWYQQGSSTASGHDYQCVDEQLRAVLGLPRWEDDPTHPRYTPAEEDSA